TVHFTVTVDKPLPQLTTQITNVVTSSEGTCQTPSPACTVSDPTVAQLTTAKTLFSVNGEPAAPGETVRPGDKLTYEITVENHGAPPPTPTLPDKAPADPTYSGEASEGWGPTCVAAPASPAGTPCTQVVTVPAASASEAGKATVHFTVTVDKPLPPGATQISNVVTSTVGTCQAPE